MKKLLILVLSIMMVLGSFTTAFAANRKPVENKVLNITTVELDEFNKTLKQFQSNNTMVKARALEVLEILKGTDKGLELEKGLTRAEGSAIYSRLFALDYKVNALSIQQKGYNTGFNDVPEWAKKIVNYLKYSEIVNGINEKEFGSNNSMTAEQFTTLVLRGLGYNDKAGDFTWDKSLEKAVEIGLLTQGEKLEIEKDKQFTRQEMASVSYNTLFQKNKETHVTLIQDRTKELGNDTGVTQLLYINLTDEEIAELDKISEINKPLETPYVVFSNDKVKQGQLYNKLINMSKNSLELFKFELMGDNVEINTIGIESIKRSDVLENVVIVEFKTDNKNNIAISTIIDKDKGTLKNSSDTEFSGQCSNKVIYDKLMEKYDVSVKNGYYQIGSRSQGISKTYSIVMAMIPEHDVEIFYDRISDEYSYKTSVSLQK